MSIFNYGKAICYSGYREGQSPMGQMPALSQIEEDLEILNKEGYVYIRMYDPNEHARMVLQTIRDRALPMKCIIGIDSLNEVNNATCPFVKQEFTDEELAEHAARNDRELDKLIALVKEYPDEVAAVSVGNENTPVWTAHKVPTERLIEHVRKLKSSLDKPVSFCEGGDDWPNIPELAREVDFICCHSYPYHVNVPVPQAVDYNKNHLKRMRELYPDKEIIFTEVGWSSCVSLEDEKNYIEALTAWLEEEKIVAFIFEAFDELWKGPTPESSECCFGLYGNDRIRKW